MLRQSSSNVCCAAAPDASLLAGLPEPLLDHLLGQLPLHVYAIVAAVSNSLRAAVMRLREYSWLAKARHYPARHPLKQASCARAFLDQQHLIHAKTNVKEEAYGWLNIKVSTCVGLLWRDASRPADSSDGRR